MQRLVDCSDFKHGRLPFKYLGVPISNKKLSAADHEQLIDKMVSRIWVWSSRNISFASRRQLVNFVLMSLCFLRSQIFLLPQKILKQMNAICRFIYGLESATLLGLGMLVGMLSVFLRVMVALDSALWLNGTWFYWKTIKHGRMLWKLTTCGSSGSIVCIFKIRIGSFLRLQGQLVGLLGLFARLETI